MIATESPRAAIMEAWRKIDVETRRAAERLGIALDRCVPALKVFQKLVGRDAVDADMQGVYNRIRKLRNEAAHATDFQLSYEETVRYVELAMWLADLFRRIEQ